MEDVTLLNGNIVNEYDEVVGSYRYIVGDCYWVELYGSESEMTRKALVDKVVELELYTVPIWD